MNKKAQIATVVAVLLGVFLVVVTAIKFDWVGMVVRGDKIIDFSSNKDTTNDDSKKPTNSSENINQETTEEPSEEVEDDNKNINLSCEIENSNNDTYTMIIYTYSFYNGKLMTGENNVVINQMNMDNKAPYDELVKTYSNLVLMYAENPTVHAEEVINEESYNYYSSINYESETFENDVVDKTINPNLTIEEIKNYYETLNYSCTQS